MSDFENQQHDYPSQPQDQNQNGQRSFSEVEFNQQPGQPSIDPQFQDSLGNNNQSQYQQKTLYSQADEDTPYEPQQTNDNFNQTQYSDQQQQQFQQQQQYSYNQNQIPNENNNLGNSMHSNNSNQQQNQNQQNQSIADGIVDQYQQYHTRLPEYNFTFTLLLIFILPAIGEIAQDYTAAFQFGGIGVFLIYMIFSICAMYGVEKQSNLALLIYQNVSFVYAIGFIGILAGSLIALIGNEDYEYLSISKTQTVILLIISVPIAIWMFLTVKVTQKLIAQIKTKTE